MGGNNGGGNGSSGNKDLVLAVNVGSSPQGAVIAVNILATGDLLMLVHVPRATVKAYSLEVGSLNALTVVHDMIAIGTDAILESLQEFMKASEDEGNQDGDSKV